MEIKLTYFAYKAWLVEHERDEAQAEKRKTEERLQAIYRSRFWQWSRWLRVLFCQLGLDQRIDAFSASPTKVAYGKREDLLVPRSPVSAGTRQVLTQMMQALQRHELEVHATSH